MSGSINPICLKPITILQYWGRKPAIPNYVYCAFSVTGDISEVARLHMQMFKAVEANTSDETTAGLRQQIILDLEVVLPIATESERGR